MKKLKKVLSNFKKENKKKKGFTLIELIAVIAILGILALVLIPNVTAYTTKAKVAKAVTDAGLICRAIDAYEAETSDGAATTIVDSTNEGSKALSVIASSPTIVSTDATIASLPSEFTSSYAEALTIDKIRAIAAKTLTPTFDSKGYITGTK